MIKKGGKHVSYSLNEKIKDLKPYDPIQGEYQIRLDANESFLSVPNDILEQFHTSVNQIVFNRWTSLRCKKQFSDSRKRLG